MTTQSSQQVALFSVWGAVMAVSGALWASKGNPIVGLIGLVSGLVIVYQSHEMPGFDGAKWFTPACIVAVVVQLIMILDWIGIVGNW